MPKWMDKARSLMGKKESDRAFDKDMSKGWKLFGLNFSSIVGSSRAWCGLFVAVMLAGSGFMYQHNGAGARNWGKYGQEVVWKRDGIPEGATVHINHNLDCNSSKGNHVAFANGDCSVKDLMKSRATFDLLGGNQSDRVKVSTYSVKEICNVRWPPGEKKPGPVLTSKNCSSGSRDNESTR